jgi:hypothetical protein
MKYGNGDVGSLVSTVSRCMVMHTLHKGGGETSSDAGNDAAIAGSEGPGPPPTGPVRALLPGTHLSQYMRPAV